MNDLQLKTLWQQSEPPAPAPARDADVLRTMKTKLRKFDRTLFWRDARELLAGAFILVWFGHAAIWGDFPPLARAGNAVIVASGILIATVLLLARRRDRAPGEPASVADALRDQLRKVARQESLLRNVLWWYLLPLFVGLEMFTFGLDRPPEVKLTMTAVFLFTYAVIYWANRHAARRHIRPLADEIRQTLATLECLDENTSNPRREG